MGFVCLRPCKESKEISEALKLPEIEVLTYMRNWQNETNAGLNAIPTVEDIRKQIEKSKAQNTKEHLVALKGKLFSNTNTFNNLNENEQIKVLSAVMSYMLSNDNINIDELKEQYKANNKTTNGFTDRLLNFIISSYNQQPKDFTDKQIQDLAGMLENFAVGNNMQNNENNTNIPSSTEQLMWVESNKDNLIAKYLKENGNFYDPDKISAIEQEMQDIKSKAIADGTFMKAPNGKHTNLTERQWLQVRTKNFINWFGDWINDPANSSKVIDENGEPLVVYHGSHNNTFTVFDTTKSENKKEHTYENIHYFTENKASADTYGDSRAFFLNIRTPHEYDFEGRSWMNDDWSGISVVYARTAARLGEGFKTKEEAEAFRQKFLEENPNYQNDADYVVVDTNSYLGKRGETTDEQANKARKEGKDGTIFNNVLDYAEYEEEDKEEVTAPHKEFTVFNSNQIKSATDNIGTFSRTNDDIRYNKEVSELFDIIDYIATHEKHYEKSENRNYELLSKYHEKYYIPKAYGNREQIKKFIQNYLTRNSLPSNLIIFNNGSDGNIYATLNKDALNDVIERNETNVALNDLFNTSEEAQTVITVLNRLSSITGVKYKTITEREANSLLKNKVDLSNTNAFVHNGVCYFIQGRKLNTDIAAEEMLHPFVASIKANNPKAFDALLADARKAFPKLRLEIAKAYPTGVKEEELVTQALSRAFRKDIQDNPEGHKLKSLIKNFINYVKAIFKSNIGENEYIETYFTNIDEILERKTISAQDLNSNITISGLAQIINSDIEKINSDVNIFRQNKSEAQQTNNTVPKSTVTRQLTAAEIKELTKKETVNQSVNPINQLHSVFYGQKLENRLNLIATKFTKVLDYMVKTEIDEIDKELASMDEKKERGKFTFLKHMREECQNNTLKARQYVLQNYEISDLMDAVKKELMQADNNSENPAYQEIEKYFEGLVEMTLPIINKMESVRISIDNKTVDVQTDTQNDLDNISQEDDNTRRAEGNSGWGFKIKLTDPYNLCTHKIKNLLRKINTSKIDDLGNKIMEDPALIYAILLEAHDGMLTADDFMQIKKESTEYGEVEYPVFPYLEKIKSQYPWVNSLETALIEAWQKQDNEILAAFYSAMRTEFQEYKSDGATNMVSLNTKPAFETFKNDLTDNIIEGNMLVEDSIYDKAGMLNETGIKNSMKKIVDLLNVDSATKKTDKYNEQLKQELPDILKALGIKDVSALNNMSKQQLTTVLNLAKNILTNLQTQKEPHVASYLPYLPAIAKLSDMLNNKTDEFSRKNSFMIDGKNYQSYSAPSFLTKTFRMLQQKTAEMIEKYKRYWWFFNDETQSFNCQWIKDIAEDTSKTLGNMYNVVTTLDDKGEVKTYEDFNERDILTIQKRAFIDRYAKIGTTKIAAYPVPIFAEAPFMTFIYGKIYSNDEILDAFVELVELEILRNEKIEARKNNPHIMPIAAWDNTKGFHFFPEFNKDLEFLTAIKNTDKAARRELIRNKVQESLDSYYVDWLSSAEPYGLTEDNDFDKNYIYNTSFATANIIMLTNIDPAFYKNGVNFQKRNKENHASGLKLFTKAKYGKETERMVILKDVEKPSRQYNEIKKGLEKGIQDKRMSKLEANFILSQMKKINATDAQAFRTLDSYVSVMSMLGKLTPELENSYLRIKNGTWNGRDVVAVYNAIKPFVKTQLEKPDGLGGKMLVPMQNKNSESVMLSIYAEIAPMLQSPVMVGLNKWMIENNIDVVQFESAVKEGAQGVIDIFTNPDAVHGYFSQFEQNIKKFKLDKMVKKELETSEKSEKEVREELEQWFESKKSVYEQEWLTEWMEESLANGTLNQESYNTIEQNLHWLEGEEDQVVEKLNELTKVNMQSFEGNTDVEKLKMMHQTYGENIEDGDFNPMVVHEISYDDYMIVQPSPEHLFDHEVTLGSQFQNLLLADLDNVQFDIDGQKLSRDEVVKLVNQIITKNVKNKFSQLDEKFKDIHKLKDFLIAKIKDSSDIDPSILTAFEIVTVKNANGQDEEVFNLPLDIPSISQKLQSVLFSIFRNEVTAQKVTGGQCVLMSNIGYTSDLNLVIEDGVIKKMECYIPLPTENRDVIMKMLKQTPEGYYMLDPEMLDEDARKMIGYRIPTEGKYSMCPLIIKGFLPQHFGNTIMLPEEVTKLSGCDFDIDKMFLMLKKIKINEETGKLYVEKYDYSKSPEEQSKHACEDALINVSFAVLTHPSVFSIYMSVGTFDTIKTNARILEILNDSSLQESFCQKYNLKNNDELINKLEEFEKSKNLDELDDFLKNAKQEQALLNPKVFAHYHRQNMTGGKLIGVYAINTVAQAKCQNSGIVINKPFMVDGLLLKEFDKVTSSFGERISKNCAEFQAASVDNVKDPVLEKLLQDKNTAGVTGVMLRLGIPIKTISLLFNLLDGEIYFETKDGEQNLNFNTVEQFCYLSGANKKFKGAVNITTNELYKLNLTKNSEDVTLQKAMIIMSRCKEIANDIIPLNVCLRADSVTGALKSTMADNEYLIQQYKKVSNKQLTTVSGYDKVTNMSNVTDTDILSKTIAYREYGVEKAYDNICKLFYTNNESYRKTLNDLHALTKKGILSQELIDAYHKEYLEYALSKSDFLGDEENASYIQKKEYYLYEFPSAWNTFKQRINKEKKYTDFEAIKHLVVKNGEIMLADKARLSKEAKLKITRSFDEMLQSKDETLRNIAINLFKYSLYKNNLNSSLNSFGDLFSANFINVFTRYTNALRNINQTMTNEEAFKFQQQFILNHYSEENFLPSPKGAKKVNGEVKVPLHQVSMYKKEDGTTVITPLITTGKNREDLWVVQTVNNVEKVVKENNQYFVYFRKVDMAKPDIKGYNANQSIEEFAEYRTSESLIAANKNLNPTYKRGNEFDAMFEQMTQAPDGLEEMFYAGAEFDEQYESMQQGLPEMEEPIDQYTIDQGQSVVEKDCGAKICIRKTF